MSAGGGGSAADLCTPLLRRFFQTRLCRSDADVKMGTRTNEQGGRADRRVWPPTLVQTSRVATAIHPNTSINLWGWTQLLYLYVQRRKRSSCCRFNQRKEVWKDGIGRRRGSKGMFCRSPLYRWTYKLQSKYFMTVFSAFDSGLNLPPLSCLGAMDAESGLPRFFFLLQKQQIFGSGCRKNDGNKNIWKLHISSFTGEPDKSPSDALMEVHSFETERWIFSQQPFRLLIFLFNLKSFLIFFYYWTPWCRCWSPLWFSYSVIKGFLPEWTPCVIKKMWVLSFFFVWIRA